MAKYISGLNIECFRGLADLKLANFGDINIFVGDNNSGKTSVLEALAMFRRPDEFHNVLKVARMRENSVFGAMPVYEGFMGFFNKTEGKALHLGINAYGEIGDIDMKINGINKVLSIEHPIRYHKYFSYSYDKAGLRSGEAEGFIGELSGTIDERIFSEDILINANTKPSDVASWNRRGHDFINVVYLSPLAHLQGNVFNKAIRNDSYKEVCLYLLSLFDENITDLLYLKNENTAKAIEYVKHKRLGIMPLSTYGDGVKKVLSLANGIAAAAGGILLIDEIETSINYKYYSDIFSFVVKACRQFDVQIFITTHNSEAIDGLLETQSYYYETEYDPIRVITLRRDRPTAKIYVRTLTGKEVYDNRKQFGFEVRL